LADRGIRVSGNPHPALLQDLSNEIPVTLKFADERGWFCDSYFTPERILNVLSEFGYTLHTMYDSQSVAPGKGQLQPSSMMVFATQITRSSRAYLFLLFCVKLLFTFFTLFFFSFFFFFFFFALGSSQQ